MPPIRSSRPSARQSGRSAPSWGPQRNQPCRSGKGCGPVAQLRPRGGRPRRRRSGPSLASCGTGGLFRRQPRVMHVPLSAFALREDLARRLLFSERFASHQILWCELCQASRAKAHDFVGRLVVRKSIVMREVLHPAIMQQLVDHSPRRPRWSYTRMLIWTRSASLCGARRMRS